MTTPPMPEKAKEMSPALRAAVLIQEDLEGRNGFDSFHDLDNETLDDIHESHHTIIQAAIDREAEARVRDGLRDAEKERQRLESKLAALRERCEEVGKILDGLEAKQKQFGYWAFNREILTALRAALSPKEKG